MDLVDAQQSAASSSWAPLVAVPDGAVSGPPRDAAAENSLRASEDGDDPPDFVARGAQRAAAEAKLERLMRRSSPPPPPPIHFLGRPWHATAGDDDEVTPVPAAAAACGPAAIEDGSTAGEAEIAAAVHCAPQEFGTRSRIYIATPMTRGAGTVVGFDGRCYSVQADSDLDAILKFFPEDLSMLLSQGAGTRVDPQEVQAAQDISDLDDFLDNLDSGAD